MKKLTLLVLAFVIVGFSAFSQIEGKTQDLPDVESTEATYDVEALEARLYEIKEMDRSNMTQEERKALREEVRSIKNDLTASNQGVYLSFGALVIIILLLILIL